MTARTTAPRNLRAAALMLPAARLAELLDGAIDELQYLADLWAKRNIGDYNPARLAYQGMVEEIVRAAEESGLHHCPGCGAITAGERWGAYPGHIVCPECETELVSEQELAEQIREERAERELSEGVR